MSLNSVTLIGHLGKDPESRTTKSGVHTATFSLATTSKKKVNGEWQDKTEWHRCVCFDSSADFATKYLTKGRLVCVQGSIEYSKYTDKNGVERTSVDIVCNKVQALGRGDDSGQSRPAAGNTRTQANTQTRTQSAPDDSGFGGGVDDDIPF